MRLRNPGNIQTAIEAAGEMRRLLQSAKSESIFPGAGKRDGFLYWCDNYARPQMRSLFAPTEELVAELDVSYERIILAPQMALRYVNSLLNREFTTWDDRLAHLITELEQQQEFASRPGQPVVLDTSALMEGGPFIEVRWDSVDPALADGGIRLIVPILVVEELDDLLHDRHGDRRQKARNATRALIDLHRATPTEPAALPGQPDVTIEVFLDGEWHERRPNNDAEIIDQALSARDMVGKPLLLATCDLRQLYRAAAAGVQTILMPRADET